jgi:hypothetical protein
LAEGIGDRTGNRDRRGSGPGGEHAFLLTPLALVPEPSGLVLLGTGAVALLAYTARRRSRTRA